MCDARVSEKECERRAGFGRRRRGLYVRNALFISGRRAEAYAEDFAGSRRFSDPRVIRPTGRPKFVKTTERRTGRALRGDGGGGGEE